jgi:hypothetical protein
VGVEVGVLPLEADPPLAPAVTVIVVDPPELPQAEAKKHSETASSRLWVKARTDTVPAMAALRRMVFGLPCRPAKA